jgi:glycosyltransferase involved in cell wall biosynthesis
MVKNNNNLKSVDPLVTVAMPIYNAGKYLRPAVLSIMQQTLTDWELYIIDDGSTDKALSYIADVQDSRIIIIKDGQNKGLAARLNEVINLAQGRYFARLDQDDFSYPERLSKQVDALEENLDLDLLATRAIKISMEGEPLGYLPSLLSHAEITSAPWKGFCMPHPTWMGRLQWFKKNHYAEPAPYLCEDQELLLRTFEESNFSCLKEVCLAYRVRDGIGFSMLVKIRYHQLCLQLSYARNTKIISFALLAISVFIFRVMHNCYTSILDIKHAPHTVDNIYSKDLVRLKLLCL